MSDSSVSYSISMECYYCGNLGSMFRAVRGCAVFDPVVSEGLSVPQKPNLATESVLAVQAEVLDGLCHN